jgi:hypothetical protein
MMVMDEGLEMEGDNQNAYSPANCMSTWHNFITVFDENHTGTAKKGIILQDVSPVRSKIGPVANGVRCIHGGDAEAQNAFVDIKIGNQQKRRK